MALTLDELREGGYRWVVVALPDVQGRLLGKRFAASHFLGKPDAEVGICTVGLAWDLAQDAIDVPLSGEESGFGDLYLHADLERIEPFPGRRDTALVVGDAYAASGEPIEVAPRQVLRRQLDRIADVGLEAVIASEPELYVFDEAYDALRERSYASLRPQTRFRSNYGVYEPSSSSQFRAELDEALADLAYMRHAQPEFGLGQIEVTLAHGHPLEVADRHAILKVAIKEIARRCGVAATFMALPRNGDVGSSCHFHVSLRKDGEAVFAGGGGEFSRTGMAFLAGLATHLRESSLFFAGYVNSYKRHVNRDFHGEKSGWPIGWDVDNRLVPLRVVGRGDSLRIEHRFPGADANPYLAAAAILAAGLDGIERGLDPGPALSGNPPEGKHVAITATSLAEATGDFAESGWIDEAFGAQVQQHYAEHGRQEWIRSLASVSSWEQERGFEAA